jgi:hypothetical protein
MFSLDHRLSEIRPSASELRVARQLRDAAGSPSRPARSIGETVRGWLDAGRFSSHPSGLSTR